MKKLDQHHTMKKTIVLITLLFGLLVTPKASAQITPYLGQIEAVSFNFAPQGWLKCEGQLLPIAQFDALYTLIGTTYGGDGQVTFALPDYRGRTLIGVGTGPGLSTRTLGEVGGTTSVTLSVANLPQHNHPITASTGAGTTSSPTNGVYANTGLLDREYSDTPNAVMSTTSSAGSNSPFPLATDQPYLGINYIIAIEGIFPAQN